MLQKEGHKDDFIKTYLSFVQSCTDLMALCEIKGFFWHTSDGDQIQSYPAVSNKCSISVLIHLLKPALIRRRFNYL